MWIKRIETNHKKTVFISLKLHCRIYILGPFISPSLSLLLVPDLFIVSSLVGGSPILVSNFLLSWQLMFMEREPSLFICSCSGLGWKHAV